VDWVFSGKFDAFFGSFSLGISEDLLGWAQINGLPTPQGKIDDLLSQVHAIKISTSN
jgi:hypothetical protein